MASSKKLLELIRQGAAPREILKQLAVPPSILRRMLSGKILRRRLKLEEDLAAAVVLHGRKASVHDMANRLLELSCCEKDETARKVCIELLKDGLGETGRAGEPEQIDDKALLKHAVNAGRLPPWVLLTPPDEIKKRKANNATQHANRR